MKTESYNATYIDFYKKKISYLIIAFLILFTYTIFTYSISYIHNINLYYVTLLDLLSYVLFSPFIIDLIKNGKVNLLEPIYITNGVFYLYFVFKPSMDLLFNLKYYFGMDLFPYLPRATIYVIIGIIMLTIGYYSNLGVSTFIKNFFHIKKLNNPSKAVRYAIILLLIGTVLFYLYTKILGISFLGLITLNLFNGSKINVVNSNLESSNPLINYLYSSITYC